MSQPKLGYPCRPQSRITKALDAAIDAVNDVLEREIDRITPHRRLDEFAEQLGIMCAPHRSMIFTEPVAQPVPEPAIVEIEAPITPKETEISVADPGMPLISFNPRPRPASRPPATEQVHTEPATEAQGVPVDWFASVNA